MSIILLCRYCYSASFKYASPYYYIGTVFVALVSSIHVHHITNSNTNYYVDIVTMLVSNIHVHHITKYYCKLSLKLILG